MLVSPSTSNTQPVTVSQDINNTTLIATKRKRRPAGTPDPDAEVVSLSPKTLLESDRYVCDICNQGFRRDQNLQMHRRRHKVPWKLLKKEAVAATAAVVKKRVYVCPEPTCLHHNPAHALGDLVGIKKHFRRKHGGRRQWVCNRCSKGYAVQSDYKAHLKTCGTRGHSCDCGRVFSRVESFIEHQDSCQVCQSRVTEPPTPPLDQYCTLTGRELQLLPNGPPMHSTKLGLTLGPITECRTDKAHVDAHGQLERLREEKFMADKVRESAKKEVESAEKELAEARGMLERAQAELRNAYAFREHTVRMLLQVTCNSCRKGYRMETSTLADEKSTLTFSQHEV